ncbi:MAG TPA: transglutaminase-like domain-containing protein [Blastocatellia bacterium]|nr:transglutaminase-like domain-containing protein [Blastocatellia bacterium]
MNTSLKRASAALGVVFLLTVALFFPALPWSARCRHALHRIVTKAEMKLASWQGHEPRLVSITGGVGLPGVEVQALDSKSGWVVVTDRDGKFTLPDVLWYPGAVFDLIVSTDGKRGRLISITAPADVSEGGSFSVGYLDPGQGREVTLDDLPGVRSTTYVDFDVKNRDYYEELFHKLTSGKMSDAEKADAINSYVATKLNYNETQREMESPRRVLERGSQYCGQLSAAMITLLAAGGYSARGVDMIGGSPPRNTHFVVEVFYDEAWRLYDPTFGVKYQRADGTVMSYRDVRLDTSLISEDVFRDLRGSERRRVLEWMPQVYGTGYHHYYVLRRP